MQRPVPAAVDRSTALRYLGASGWQPDAASAALLDRAEQMLRETVTPRAVWRVVSVSTFPVNEQGRDLQRHLQGCEAVLLLAATLGAQLDTLLRRLELSDIALAAMADAMASVLLEQVCDELEAELRQHWAKQGRYLTGRFAPGYGDCPLELNDRLCLLADSVRGCGLAVTPQHLLTPRKSTTALLGLADHPVTGARAGCATCHLRTSCAYRQRGTTCFSDTEPQN